jgi:Sulfotransferase family
MAGALDYLTDASVSAAALSKPIDWLESGTVPARQLCNIQYHDLVADPIACIARLYDYFGLELSAESRAAMQAYVQANPRSARPAHQYNPQAFEKSERRAYDRYQKYFGVASE